MYYFEGNLSNGGFIVMAESHHSGKDSFFAANAEELAETFADFERDYGLDGWTFKVYELSLNERQYNILPPEPAKLVLI